MRGSVYPSSDRRSVSSWSDIPKVDAVIDLLPSDSGFLGDAFTAEMIMEVVERNCDLP